MWGDQDYHEPSFKERHCNPFSIFIFVGSFITLVLFILGLLFS